MLENFEEKPVSDINNAMHAFPGTPRALPVFAREGVAGLYFCGRTATPDLVATGNLS